MCIHTSTYKGKSVRVVLRNGTVFEDKYLDTKSKHILFKDKGWILKETIKNFSIRKLNSVQRNKKTFS